MGGSHSHTHRLIESKDQIQKRDLSAGKQEVSE